MKKKQIQSRILILYWKTPLKHS